LLEVQFCHRSSIVTLVDAAVSGSVADTIASADSMQLDPVDASVEMPSPKSTETIANEEGVQRRREPRRFEGK
jgi:ACT domain-containing protein